MSQKFRAPRRAFAAVFVIAAAAAISVLTAASHAAGPTSHPITISPRISGLERASLHHFGCQDASLASGGRCYQPFQMQAAYNLAPLLASGTNGAGRTIVIVDAYGSPTISSDLADFDAEFSLQAPPQFSIIDPAGNPPPFTLADNNAVGWGEETSLDVQWAHAMAPAANIVLAVAPSSNDTDILAVTQYVIDHKVGDVISQSFGEAESCVDPQVLAAEHAAFQEATAKGITLFASSGDSGSSQFSCDGKTAIESASSPASDPNVTGVGGTTLLADGSTGAYQSETAWTETAFGCNPPAVAPSDINCSGGGFSTLWPRPSWQRALVKGGDPHPGRGVPDVSYNAGSSGGVLTHIGFLLPLFGLSKDAQAYFAVGGTSAGSPQWAGLAADAAQLAGHDLGNINQTLYQIGQAQQAYAADFHDVIGGNNDVAEIGGFGFDAVAGWDAVTGLGSPNAANLLPALAKKN
jgi:subtilase family serine protease